MMSSQPVSPAVTKSSMPRPILLVNLGITAAAVLFLLVHLIWPQLIIDNLTLGLIAVAVLPWLGITTLWIVERLRRWNRSAPHGDYEESIVMSSQPVSPVVTKSSMPRPILSVNLGITAAAVLFLLVHLIWPHLIVDNLTLGLIAVAVLPWLGIIFKSAELPFGWKFEFREVQRKIEQQNEDIKYLKFLFANFLSDWEITHLRNLNSNQPFTFNKSKSFDQELRRLRALGFIEPLNDQKGISSMNAEPNGDVKHHFRITERGLLYLKMREELLRVLPRSVDFAG